MWMPYGFAIGGNCKLFQIFPEKFWDTAFPEKLQPQVWTDLNKTVETKRGSSCTKSCSNIGHSKPPAWQHTLTMLRKFFTHANSMALLWCATLLWWWGLKHRRPKRFLKSGGKEPTKSWPNSCRQIATRYQCFCAGFGFTADYGFTAIYLRLYSRLFMASQPSTAL